MRQKKPRFPILPSVSNPSVSHHEILWVLWLSYQYSFIWADFLPFLPNISPLSLCKAAVAKLHRLGGLNNRNEFSVCSETESSRWRCLREWVLMRALFLVSRSSLSLSSRPFCSGERESSGVPSSSYKDTNPIGLGPHFMTSFNPITSLKSPISKYPCNNWGEGFKIWI